MLSRFFIHRPIFATVLSIVVITMGLTSLVKLPIAQYPDLAPPTIAVQANYPGANASVVADTVAAPIEQEVNGVEGMLYMSSISASDGSYTLTITFEPGTDLDIASVQVQNRVSSAEPSLPEDVRRLGITTKKKMPDFAQMISIFRQVPSGRRAMPPMKGSAGRAGVEWRRPDVGIDGTSLSRKRSRVVALLVPCVHPRR